MCGCCSYAFVLHFLYLFISQIYNNNVIYYQKAIEARARTQEIASKNMAFLHTFDSLLFLLSLSLSLSLAISFFDRSSFLYTFSRLRFLCVCTVVCFWISLSLPSENRSLSVISSILLSLYLFVSLFPCNIIENKHARFTLKT